MCFRLPAIAMLLCYVFSVLGGSVSEVLSGTSSGTASWSLIDIGLIFHVIASFLATPAVLAAIRGANRPVERYWKMSQVFHLGAVPL
jgi:hypothetical protein